MIEKSRPRHVVFSSSWKKIFQDGILVENKKKSRKVGFFSPQQKVDSPRLRTWFSKGRGGSNTNGRILVQLVRHSGSGCGMAFCQWCQCNKHHQNFLRSKCQWVLICVQLKHRNQAVGETFDSYKCLGWYWSHGRVTFNTIKKQIQSSNHLQSMLGGDHPT